MSNAHAILGPSSAYRWITCTPSARFEQQIPEEASDYAAEGDLAHAIAALILENRAGIFKGDFLRQMGELEARELFSLEMLDHAEDYAEFVRSFGGTILVEQKYDLSSYIPLGFGTTDATNVTPKILYITDLKYGAGVRVFAKKNPQLMIYALGALLAAQVNSPSYNPEKVVMNIYQPRAGGVSTWEITPAELYDWASEVVAPAAKLAIAGQGDFVAGPHCQFCKARTVCAAYYRRFADLLDIQDARVMTPEMIKTVIDNGQLLASWVKKVEEDAVKQIERGKRIPGLKIVAGRGRRSFKNEDDVVDILIGESFDSDAIFDAKLKALTEIEKMLGVKRFKSLFSDIVINAQGRPQLADENDDRPALGASAADEYDDLL